MFTRLRISAALAITCGVLLGSGSTAQAQFQTRVINLPTFKTTGEYIGMVGRYMKVTLDGEVVMVQFDAQQSKIKVTGTAVPEYLAPGMCVKFKGTFDRHGKATEPIKEFTLFTPTANDTLGAYDNSGGDAFSQSSPTQKKGPKPTTSPYSISGKITSVHKDQIFVNCGNMKVKADVAPDATVKLDTTDPSWASQGDKVTIQGAKLGGGRVIGIDVAIELAKPLEPKKKNYGNHVIERTNLADKGTTDKFAKPTDKDANAKKPDASGKPSGTAGTGKPADKDSDAKKPAGTDAKGNGTPPGDSTDPGVFGK